MFYPNLLLFLIIAFCAWADVTSPANTTACRFCTPLCPVVRVTVGGPPAAPPRLGVDALPKLLGKPPPPPSNVLAWMSLMAFCPDANAAAAAAAPKTGPTNGTPTKEPNAENAAWIEAILVSAILYFLDFSNPSSLDSSIFSENTLAKLAATSNDLPIASACSVAKNFWSLVLSSMFSLSNCSNALFLACSNCCTWWELLSASLIRPS